jgi:hypothetical protein
MAEMEYLFYITVSIIIIVILYKLYVFYHQENLSMGTITQLQALGPQDRYLTGDPIPYDTWIYNPLTFWNYGTRRSYGYPYYLGRHRYYGDYLL